MTTKQNKFYKHNETPKEVDTASAEPTSVPVVDNKITDKKGNVITLQEITGRMRLAFYRALGADDCKNTAVILELFPVMAVKAINGDPVGNISSIAQIEIVHAKIDDGQVTNDIMEWLGTREKNAEGLNDPKAIKKS